MRSLMTITIDTHPCPPRDGSISVLPGFLDFHVQHNPNRPYFVYPSADPSSYTPDKTTYKEFSDASHRVAHAVRPVGTGTDREVVAILVDCDIVLYHAITMGVIRAGLVPFTIYTKLTAVAVAHMLRRVDCHRIIYSSSLELLIEGIRSAVSTEYHIQADVHPSLVDIFPSFASRSPVAQAVQPYPLPSPSPTPSDVVVYLHSSGSTGLPKPIAQTGITILHWCNMPVFTRLRECNIRWAAMASYGFGTFGYSTQLYSPLVSGLPTSLFPPQEHLGLPPVAGTPEKIIDAARRTRATAIPTAPWALELWVHNEDHITFLASLSAVMFSGSPLSAATGKKLVARGVRLYSLYAATEFGPISDIFDPPEEHSIKKTRDEFAWLQFPPMISPRWVPYGDGTYELYLMTCTTHQPSVENLPNGDKGYATSDLWVQHPTKPELWRIAGRTDDVLILSSGWNFVPIPQETHLATHPLIAGAVMFCPTGYMVPGVLIELVSESSISPGDHAAEEKFMEAIWEQIKEANDRAPAFGQIFREMVIFADPKRPFPRSWKGTPQRKLVLAQYAADIDALYERVDVTKFKKV